ncbi:MAG TPA: L,D-transpeptidase family protein [Gaiellaceae bacterium]|jgi:N-acetylmuramoyl-L-alanine amidase
MRAPLSLVSVVFVAALATLAPAWAAAAGDVAGAGDTISLSKPRVTSYGAKRVIRGALAPARAGVSIDLVRAGAVVAQRQTAADGRFSFALRLVSPGPYRARSGSVVSNSVSARIRPILTTSLQGERVVGQPLRLRARLQPAAAGKLRLIVVRGHYRPLSRFITSSKPFTFALSSAARHTVWVEVEPNAGYTQIARKTRVHVTAPPLYLGSHGRAVHLLESELIAHNFALLYADSAFGTDTLEAVYALQKFSGLSRSGRMTAAAWRALGRSTPPRPRLHGSYIEIDKTKQVLYVVRSSKVTLIVPVSTGATGNTPIGVFHVYSKVPGGAVMYYSNYFIGGFAIHGYVSVPPYPASHGCVRVPMWLATHLYGLISYGMRVYIHY